MLARENKSLKTLTAGLFGEIIFVSDNKAWSA
jgi:hypothetical protein